MPGISARLRARCGECCTQPDGVDVRCEVSCQYVGLTEADTGATPPVTSTCDERPVCQSWENIRPPLAWTRARIFGQPVTCASEYRPGAPCQPRPVIEMWV